MVAKKKASLNSDKKEDVAVLVENKEQKENQVTDIKPKQKQWIAEAAYYFAERRSFMPGNEQEDWGMAEQEYKKAMLIE